MATGPPGIPQLDPSKMQLVAELEIEMMSDMYNRMTAACHRKCVPPKYRDAELSKGESVCLDRCVAKYLDIHERIGKKLTTMSMQDEELMKKLQEQQQQPLSQKK
ncbi:mitochondrial import inner membrane translocase subunit Tim10-like [Tachypleus tridentatus]|uniref:mitochondrial import inner membrane translocase subunit Tim10-like n=1 Tax=Tachypleus tridentatus TaxID=6853 RepID=UPI003FD58360